MLPVIAAATGIVAAREIVFLSIQQKERDAMFLAARREADLQGKPLLVVGSPLSRRSASIGVPPQYPCGDFTLDSDPFVLNICPDAIVGDVRSIPLDDGQCGAVFISHVLEHLPSLEDFEKAFNECIRVGGQVFVAHPRANSLVANAIPDHHLRMVRLADGWLVEEMDGRRMAVFHF